MVTQPVIGRAAHVTDDLIVLCGRQLPELTVDGISINRELVGPREERCSNSRYIKFRHRFEDLRMGELNAWDA